MFFFFFLRARITDKHQTYELLLHIFVFTHQIIRASEKKKPTEEKMPHTQRPKRFVTHSFRIRYSVSVPVFGGGQICMLSTLDVYLLARWPCITSKQNYGINYSTRTRWRPKPVRAASIDYRRLVSLELISLRCASRHRFTQSAYEWCVLRATVRVRLARTPNRVVIFRRPPDEKNFSMRCAKTSTNTHDEAQDRENSKKFWSGYLFVFAVVCMRH